MDFGSWDISFSPELPETRTLEDFRLADSLVLSGGGMKGIYILGAIEYLSQEVGLNHLKAFYGVSIGAVISTLLMVGYTPLEVMAQICVNKIAQKIAVIDKNIIERKSLFDPKHFVQILEEMISAKLGNVPSLKEFYEQTGKDLYITTVCLSTPYRPVYLHHLSHPDLKLSAAVHMSMSIPFAFGYAEYDGKKYIDGGVLDNFPILYASEKNLRPFGICMKNDDHPTEETSFLNEVLFILTLPISYISELSKKHCPKHATFIELDTGEGADGFLAFGRQNEAIYQMFTKGYNECKKLLV